MKKVVFIGIIYVVGIFKRNIVCKGITIFVCHFVFKGGHVWLAAKLLLIRVAYANLGQSRIVHGAEERPNTFVGCPLLLSLLLHIYVEQLLKENRFEGMLSY